MFEESINYPREGGDSWKTIAIGGVLGILSFLVVPVFLVLGYGARVLRDAADDPGTESAPVFDDWGELLVDGLKLFVVSLAYLLVPLVIFGVTTGGLVVAILTGSQSLTAGAILGALGGFVVAGLLTLLIYYFLPAALTFVAMSGSVADGFAIGRIRALVTTREYAVRWLVALGVLVVVGAITSVLSATGIGALVVPFVSFYGMVSAYYLYGGAVGVVEPGADEADPDPTAGQAI
ncbi:DUF4013 domain-containing protein [Haloglomus salinum]|uniref:DUF4013 domain-containing protein n=1 Tax=Haloglomus salinum TaxID=2962673 RepID=UPI0020C9FB87|nr:DUF4013 domain-containing protein [Haloglomus salinum]